MPVGHLYVFRKMSVQVLSPLLNRVIWFLAIESSSSHILNINPLSDIWFANIFFHSTGCLFTLVIVSFALQKLFSLVQSHLSVFAFVA